MIPPFQQRRFKAVAIALSATLGAAAVVVFYVPIMTWIALLATHVIGAVITPLKYEANHDVRMLIQPVENVSIPLPTKYADSVLLTFEDNPKVGMVVDRSQLKSLQHGTQVVTARIHVWGYRLHGVKGYNLVSVNGEIYTGPTTTYGRSD